MSDLETVNWLLGAVRACPPHEIHKYFSPALTLFRFLPAAERRQCAREFKDWAYAHAERESLKCGYADFLEAMDHFRREEHDASLQKLTEARTRFEELHDPEGRGLTSMLIGGTYRTLGHFDLALKVLWEGYGLLKESGHYPAFVAAAANGIANINLELHQYNEALGMFEVTRDESARAGDYYFTNYALQGLGKVHLHHGQLDAAKEQFTQALQLAQQHENPLQIAASLTELADLHLRSDDLASAESLHGRALAIREEHHLTGGAVTSCVRLGEIHIRRSQWDDALAVLNKGLSIAEQSHVKPRIAQVQLMLSRLHEGRHELEKSLLHYKRYHELREEVER